MLKTLLLSFFLLCLPAVQGFSAVPTVQLNQPAAPDHTGQGISGEFVIVIGDTSGVSDISWAWLAFGGGGANACGLVYYRAWNQVYIVSDDGTIQYGGFAPGSNNLLGNGQCVVNMANVIVGVAGNFLAITYPISFTNFWTGAQNFNGLRNIYGLASNNAGQPSGGGWWQLGTWTVGGSQMKGDGTGTMELDTTSTPRTGIDDLTGLTVPLLTTLNPGVTIHISSEDDNVNALHYNEMFTVTIRHAKPNMQIWCVQYGPEGSAYGCPFSNGSTQPTAISPGYTDGAGYFAYTARQGQPEGFHAFHFYVGGGPPSPVGDPGLPGAIEDTYYIGAVTFWAYDQAGVHPPPNFNQ